MKIIRHLLVRVDGEACLVTDVEFDNPACIFYILAKSNKKITSELITDVFYETLMAFDLVPFIKTKKGGFIDITDISDDPITTRRITKVAHQYTENQ